MNSAIVLLGLLSLVQMVGRPNYLYASRFPFGTLSIIFTLDNKNIFIGTSHPGYAEYLLH